MSKPPAQSLAARLADDIRSQLASGRLRPGQRLSEANLAARMGASRNSLREAFRLLTQEGLLTHEANRGVSVAVLSATAVIDIFRARQLLECGAIRMAYPQHHAVGRMKEAIDRARHCRNAGDWTGVAEANLAFHEAIVAFADSERLSLLYRRMTAELGLAFALLPDAQSLHAPYIELNDELLKLVETDRTDEAALHLQRYLIRSERTILAEQANAAAASVNGGAKVGTHA